MALDAASRGLQHRPGREGRLRLGHLVEVVQDDPRRPPLPPAARVPARLREPGRAPAPARQRPAPGGTRSPSSSRCSAATGWSPRAWPASYSHRPVALRPHRRRAHRRAPPRRSTREQALAHLPTLRTDRLVAGFLYFDARADDARLTLTVLAHRGPRPRGRRRQLRPGRPASSPTPAARSRGAIGAPRRAPTARVRGAGLGGGQRRRRLGRRGPRPRRGHRTPTPSGRPRASTSPCPPSRLPCDIAAVIPVPEDKRSIFVVSVARDRPRLPRHHRHRLRRARSTTRPARPRTSTTSSTPPTPSPPRSSPGPTSPASGPGSARCWHRRQKGGTSRSAPPTCRAATPCAPRPHGVVTVTGGKLTTYRKMAEDTVDAVVAVLGRRGALPHQAPPLRDASRPARSAGAADRGQRATRSRRPEASGAPTWRPLRHRVRRGRWPWPTAGPSCSSRSSPGSPTSAPRSLYAVREEMAGTLDDVLARRTRAAYPATPGPPRTPPPAVAALHRPRAGLGRRRQRAEAEATPAGFAESCPDGLD